MPSDVMQAMRFLPIALKCKTSSSQLYPGILSHQPSDRTSRGFAQGLETTAGQYPAWRLTSAKRPSTLALSVTCGRVEFPGVMSCVQTVAAARNRLWLTDLGKISTPVPTCLDVSDHSSLRIFQYVSMLCGFLIKRHKFQEPYPFVVAARD